MMPDWFFASTHSQFPGRQPRCLTWLLLLILTAPLLVAPAMQAAPLGQAAGCTVLLDSNFEQATTDWQTTKGKADLSVPDPVNINSGNKVMRLGNEAPPDLIGESEVRSRSIPIPNTAYSATLRFRIYRQSVPANLVDGDWQKLLIEDANGNRQERLAKRENDNSWVMGSDNLLVYRGQAIKVVFAVYNDGKAGLTSMFVDDVVVEACTPTPTVTLTVTQTVTGTPTPTPTPSVTPTQGPIAPCIPLPANCQNLVVNSNFEYEGDWVCGADPVPARYTNEQFFGGRWSMLLGNPPDGPHVTSYSSVRQLVSIPANATLAHLCFRRLYRSEDTLLARPGPNHDRQEVIALEPDLDVIDILYRENRNENGWQQQGISLNRYIGRTFYLYFNVYNNASPQHTWMYLDDVELFYCTAAPPPPPPPPTATPAPIVILTPATETPTPLPTVTNTAVVSASAVLNLPPPTIVLVTEEIVTVKPLSDESGALVQVVTPADPFVIPNEQQVATAAPAPLATPTPLVRIVLAPSTSGWGTRLGTIAILVGILALIGIIVYVLREIWRMIWGRPDPDGY